MHSFGRYSRAARRNAHAAAGRKEEDNEEKKKTERAQSRRRVRADERTFQNLLEASTPDQHGRDPADPGAAMMVA